MLLLDTSFLIDYFRGKPSARKVTLSSDVVTTVVTYYEIMAGAKMAKAKREERFFRRFFSEVKVLDLDLKAAEASSEIAGMLRAVGRSVNPMDILIAGIALANGVERIVTKDRDFLEISKVSELDVVIYE